MEIGQVGFFNGVTGQLGLGKDTIEKLRARIDSKDSQGIKNIIKDLDIPEDVKGLMIDLPFLFGNGEVLDRADVPGLNPTSKKALDNLREIYELLTLYGFEQYISLDLGMLQSIDYYTGSIFKCYTRGIGFPIAAGGRYDNLMSGFGTSKGAVGCAIGINRIMQVYEGESNAVAGTLVYAEDNAQGLAYELAYNLRVNGCLTEMYIESGSFEDAEKYAETTNNTCILRVKADGNLVIYDLERKEAIETTVEEFLGYGDIPVMETPQTPQDMGFRRI